MATSPAGQLWLDELEKARYPWFYISTGTGWYHHHYSWNDNLDVPFASIAMHIEAIKAGKQVGRPTERLIEEAAGLVEEYRSLITNDDDRESFDQTLAISKRVFPYVEDHLFYVEHWFHSVFWNKVREVADILVDAGFFEDRDDIWLLKRGEVRDALWDHVTSWATGTRARGPSYWQQGDRVAQGRHGQVPGVEPAAGARRGARRGDRAVQHRPVGRHHLGAEELAQGHGVGDRCAQ